jgi:hypothetical protein
MKPCRTEGLMLTALILIVVAIVVMLLIAQW